MDYQFQEKKVVPFPIMKEWIYKITVSYTHLDVYKRQRLS